MSAITVQLSKPIKAHGDEVSELTFREPAVKDRNELGIPFLFVQSNDGGTGTEVRQFVISRYISRLASIPMTSVEALSMSDFDLCMATILGFFGKGDSEVTKTS